MPDSEAKKAVKKATKAPAKKSAKKEDKKRSPKSAPIETPPLNDEASEALGAEPKRPLPTPEMTLAEKIGVKLDEQIDDARKRGIPALLGTATVRLVAEIEDAAHPVDAVDQMIRQIIEYGLGGALFLVTDEVSDEVYLVRNGAILMDGAEIRASTNADG